MNAFLALCVSGAAVQDKLFLSPNVKTYISGNDLNLWWGIATGGPRVLNLPSSDQDDNPGLPNLSTALIFFKSHLATDPRDMVYALVGLTNARDDPRMQIDYSQSVRQVYISVVDYVLKRKVKLDVICGKFTSKNIYRLPSWTPDVRTIVPLNLHLALPNTFTLTLYIAPPNISSYGSTARIPLFTATTP
jgi:hypothetical protein